MNPPPTPPEAAALTAVRLGLLRLSPEDAPFLGRNGGAPFEALIDARGAGSSGPLRHFLLERLASLLLAASPTAMLVAVSKGGVLFGGLLASHTNRDVAVVLPDGGRASGLRREIEGEVADRDVWLIENVVTSGNSLRRAAATVVRHSGRPCGALAIGAYGVVPMVSVPLHAAFTLSQLVHAAHALGIIHTARLHRILAQI
jgi:orotate phosphoribosyltransferase